MTNCLYLTLFSYGLRLVVMTFLVNPWYILIVEPLSGIYQGLTYATTTLYAEKIAPEGMKATLQGFVAGLQFGIGMSASPVYYQPACMNMYAFFVCYVQILYCICY